MSLSAGSERKHANIETITELFFTKFGAPIKVEVQVRCGQQGVKELIFSSSKKETCGHRSCNRHGKWLHDKNLTIPVELLPDLVAALKSIQPSSMFVGGYRSSHIFAELYFTEHSEPKRLGVGGWYGQKAVKEVYLEISGKKRCKERSCNQGLWSWEKEVSISSDVLPDLFNALHKIEQSIKRG